jgi:hypothetical protein
MTPLYHNQGLNSHNIEMMFVGLSQLLLPLMILLPLLLLLLMILLLLLLLTFRRHNMITLFSPVST